MKLIQRNPWFFSAVLSLPGLYLLWNFPAWTLVILVPLLVIVLLLLWLKQFPPAPGILTLMVLAAGLWDSGSSVLTEFAPLEGASVFHVGILSDGVYNGRGWRQEGEIFWAETSLGTGAGAHWKVWVQSPHSLLPGSVQETSGRLSPDRKWLSLDSPWEIRQAPWWESWRSGLRDRIRERFASLGPGGAALAEALFLGIREDLSSREGDLFRKAGLSHVLALSGSHLGLWASFLPWMFPFLPRRIRKIGIPLAVLGFYVWLAGPIPSLLRAYLALVLSYGAGVSGRELKAQEGLGLSWLLLLVLRPRWFLDPGFLLSYLAMVGLLGPGVLFTASVLRGPGWLAQALGASLGAFFTVLPLGLGLFGAVQWSGLVTGLPAGVLVAGILVLCGFMMIPGVLVEEWVGTLLRPALELLMGLCRLGARVPLWETQPLGGLVLWALLGLGAVLVYKVGRERTRKLRLSQGHP